MADTVRDDQLREAVLLLKGWLEHLDPSVEIDGLETDDEIILDIEAEQMGLIIGRKGSVLEALQYLMNVLMFRRFENSKPVHLDAQGYRTKKINSLRSQLLDARDQSLAQSREVPLQPMSAADRKIVHSLCREIPGVVTVSKGTGTNRILFVVPEAMEEEFTALPDHRVNFRGMLDQDRGERGGYRGGRPGGGGYRGSGGNGGGGGGGYRSGPGGGRPGGGGGGYRGGPGGGGGRPGGGGGYRGSGPGDRGNRY